MGFKEENKHFLFHSLIREMRGLSDNEKRLKYKDSQKEIRKRLKDCYSSVLDKSNFYLEAFEALSFYEGDYLMINLFFEPDSCSVIPFLHRNVYFEQLIFIDNNSFASKYHAFILSRYNSRDKYSIEDEVQFFSANILNNVDIISEYDWKEKNGLYDRHPLISKYSKWIPHHLNDQIQLQKTLCSFLAFIKLWNYYDVFSRPFNNTKAILFYSNIILEYSNIDLNESDLFIFFSELAYILNDHFVNIEYIPLLDKKENASYKSGYLNKRKEFLELLDKAKKVIKINYETSIINLFKSLDVRNQKIISERINFLVEKKLSNYDIHDHKTLVEIKDLELDGELNYIRQELFEKLYLFEFI